MSTTMATELVFPVYEFRPLPHFRDVRRYADGRWVPDDGEFDVAFIGYDSAPMAWYVDVPYQRNILWSWHGGHWARNEPRHPGGNAWHYMLRDGESEWGGEWGRDRHPNLIASDRAMAKRCEGIGCSNGDGPEFHIDDPYITAGLLRILDTKEVVKFPERFVCMYCGEITVRKDR